MNSADLVLVVTSALPTVDSLVRGIVFTFFLPTSEERSDFVETASNLSVHATASTICLLSPFFAITAIALPAVDKHWLAAARDPIICLLNRRGFETAVGEFARSGRTSGSIVNVDGHHLKTINDSLGDDAGDRVIVDTAARRQLRSEQNMMLARFGAEEFVILLKEASKVPGNIRMGLRSQTCCDYPADAEIDMRPHVLGYPHGAICEMMAVGHSGWEQSLAAADAPAQEPISVLIVEDDAPTRQRIVGALSDQADFDVRQAASYHEACTCLVQGCPDVLLTDIQLPDGSGMDLIRRMRQKSEKTEIMVISILGDETSVISAILLGANGYILKDAFPADIADTVRDLVKGHSPISASIARFIVRRTQSRESGAPRSDLNTAKLTAREIDILWGIAKGFSYGDIADHLGISRQTVPGYIKNIYRKLEVNTRGEAVYEALQQGLIRL